MNSAPEAVLTAQTISHRGTLRLAVPVMLANLSTPLIGVVDTAVVGQLADPALIGAVAVGALIFTTLFWAFGFLRMGTAGLSAQAVGAGLHDELVAILARALLLGLAIGVALIVLQWPLKLIALHLLEAGVDVEQYAAEYFDIRIFSAPAALMNYALLGWFIGQGRTATALLIQLGLNLTNIALDAWFVMGLDMGIAGVATGTVIAEYGAAVLGLALAHRRLGANRSNITWQNISRRKELRRLFAVHRDIMIRSLALIMVFAWFTADGARHGNITLAANAVLMHLVSIGAYFLDGLAHAAEAMAGYAFGAKDRSLFRRAVSISSLWAVACAAVLSLIFAIAGGDFIALLTVDTALQSFAGEYLWWAALAPLAGVWSFQLNGIFIGATATRDMRQAMLGLLLIFLAAWWGLRGYGNHGLWAALYIHYLARAVTLGWRFPALIKSFKGERGGASKSAQR